jgi:hypothetical protein
MTIKWNIKYAYLVLVPHIVLDSWLDYVLSRQPTNSKHLKKCTKNII